MEYSDKYELARDAEASATWMSSILPFIQTRGYWTTLIVDEVAVRDFICLLDKAQEDQMVLEIFFDPAEFSQVAELARKQVHFLHKLTQDGQLDPADREVLEPLECAAKRICSLALASYDLELLSD